MRLYSVCAQKKINTKVSLLLLLLCTRFTIITKAMQTFKQKIIHSLFLYQQNKILRKLRFFESCQFFSR